MSERTDEPRTPGEVWARLEAEWKESPKKVMADAPVMSLALAARDAAVERAERAEAAQDRWIMERSNVEKARDELRAERDRYRAALNEAEV